MSTQYNFLRVQVITGTFGIGQLANNVNKSNDVRAHQVQKNLSANILHQLVKRLEKVEEITPLACATLLDPRFKKRCFR